MIYAQCQKALPHFKENLRLLPQFEINLSKDIGYVKPCIRFRNN